MKRKLWDIITNDKIPLSKKDKEQLDLILYGIVLEGKGPWQEGPKSKRRRALRCRS